MEKKQLTLTNAAILFYFIANTMTLKKLLKNFTQYNNKYYSTLLLTYYQCNIKIHCFSNKQINKNIDIIDSEKYLSTKTLKIDKRIIIDALTLRTSQRKTIGNGKRKKRISFINKGHDTQKIINYYPLSRNMPAYPLIKIHPAQQSNWLN